MIIQALAFYLFALITIAAGVMVISARNPVHSVLFLILAFFNSAGLFVLIGAEFLAMILVVVYVGAVAVLFLFVVMTLDINFAELREGVLQYLPIGALVGIILVAELVLIFGSWVVNPEAARIIAAPSAAPDRSTANVWPVMGTGVNGRGMRTCAAAAVSRANPIVSAIVQLVLRGSTLPMMTREGIVACMFLRLLWVAPL